MMLTARYISIEIIGAEVGDEELIKDAPLMAIVYVGGASQNENRPNKGDDLVIEIGRDEVTYAHTIDSPQEVLTGQSESGEILALSISDAAGTKTIIKLQVS